MDKFPGSTTCGIESGGAAPFDDVCVKTSDVTETEKLPETFSELLDIKGRPGKVVKCPQKRRKRIKRAKCFGSVIAALCGMFIVAAGAVALWKGGAVLIVLGCGFLLSGAGKVLIAGASFTASIIEIRRKGDLQTEWKAFFQRIVTAMFRELPQKCSQMKGTLRKAAVDFNYQQKNVEILNLTGSAIEFIGGIVAAVAAGQTGGVALPVISAAMIVSGAGAVVHAAASLTHLQPKASVADGIVQICNFTEMERIHELTMRSENIGINVLRLHKNYKDAKRTQQAGNVSEFCGGLLVVASGAVAVWTGGLAAVLFGAGLIVFGASGALTAGASFTAWIFGRRKKEQLLKDWKEWKQWFYHMESLKLRDLEKQSKDMADKLREVANKTDSWNSTCEKAKTGGQGISVVGGIIATAGAVGTVVTGGLLPIALGAVGAITYATGQAVSVGASVVQTVIEESYLECLQEQWNSLIPIFSRELEILRGKAKALNSELENSLNEIIRSVGSALLNIVAFETVGNTPKDPNQPDKAATGGSREKEPIAEAVRNVVAPHVSQICVDFNSLVKSIAKISYERKSHIAEMLRALAKHLETGAAKMIQANEELYSRVLNN